MDPTTLLRAAAAADAAAAAETPEQERAAVMAVMREKEAMQIGLMYARLAKASDNPHLQERLPVRESGDDIGVVEARIPADLLFRLGQQKNFGWDGVYSNEGMRDIIKAHPFTKVKTVSGKTTVPVNWNKNNRISHEQPPRRGKINFGRGTLDLTH